MFAELVTLFNTINKARGIYGNVKLIKSAFHDEATRIYSKVADIHFSSGWETWEKAKYSYNPEVEIRIAASDFLKSSQFYYESSKKTFAKNKLEKIYLAFQGLYLHNFCYLILSDVLVLEHGEYIERMKYLFKKYLIQKTDILTL